MHMSHAKLAALATAVFVASCPLARATAGDHGAAPWAPAGYYEHAAIAESSGFQTSRQHEGVYWTLNDSGNPPALFAVRGDGSLVAEVAVTGAGNYDWEALAADDDGNLWIGEIGNNSRQRDDLVVFVVPEPDPSRDDEVAVTARYPYRYPGENVDAEGMFLVGGIPHIVSKESDRAVLYRFPELREGEQVVLEAVGELPGARLVTGADISPGRRRIAVCTYDAFWVYKVDDASDDLTAFTKAEPIALANSFGPEAVGFDGHDLMLSSESRNLYRVPEWWYERRLAFPPSDLATTEELMDVAEPRHGALSVETYRDAGAPIDGAHLVMTRLPPGELAAQSDSDAPGASVTLPLTVPRADTYDIDLVLTRGPGYEVVTCWVDGARIAGEFDASADTVLPGATARFGPVALTEGAHEVRISTAHETRTLAAPSAKLGLAGMRAVSGATFAREFQVLGPFARDTWEHIDTPLAPEVDLDGLFVDLDGPFAGMDGTQIVWRDATAEDTGFLNLNASIANLTQQNAVGYALTYVHSNSDRDATVLVGSDDQVAVWLNGEEIHRHNAYRGAVPDNDAAPCRLRKGWNTVLAKIGQNGGGLALYLRFTDPSGTLTYSRVALP
jgi:hypothetical protein